MKYFRISVDVLMFALMIATIATMRGNMLVHTVLGFVFVALMAAHIFICRKWIIGVTKRLSKVKQKIRVQYIVNCFLLFAWIFCIVTGIIIGIQVIANLNDPAFLIVRRMHGVTGIIATVLTVVHVTQHHKRFVNLLRRRNTRNKTSIVTNNINITPPKQIDNITPQ